MSTGSTLADFLGARRASASPKEAGVSVDYYRRLEQGHHRHPSPQLLYALAGPLGLDETEFEYVVKLAQPPPLPRTLGRPGQVRPGTLRVAIGADVDDPRFAGLIGELTQGSEHFRELWERHELRRKTIGHKHFNNPFVGPISLDNESLSVNGGDGQTMSVHHAEPGSPDERALEELSRRCRSSSVR